MVKENVTRDEMEAIVIRGKELARLAKRIIALASLGAMPDIDGVAMQSEAEEIDRVLDVVEAHVQGISAQLGR